jgi:hypothetical protein
MSKGLILLYDDDKKTRDSFETIFPQLETEYELFSYETQEALIEKLSEDKSMNEVKALIFDLAKDDNEIKTHNYSISKYIQENFESRRIPIIIHSGHADTYNNFDGYGTVFKFEKTDKSIGEICDRLKLMCNGGFLEVFCPRGILETDIMADLHNAFIQQFKSSDQIIDIINLIQSTTTTEEFVKRVQRIFKRIAVRSLLTELLSPEVDENGDAKEEYAGITEHYVQRINKVQVWTGDIFKHNEKDEFLFILMPRCNAIRCDGYLVCPFYLGKFPEGVNAAKYPKVLTGDPTISGYQRYLPKSPVFDGGEIALSKFFMISKGELLSTHFRFISLSEELTNEVLGKFASYFFRTGITPWSKDEGMVEYKNSRNAKK